MSLFENDLYTWRETYFLFFPHEQRPRLAEVEKELKKLGPHYELADGRSDEEGGFESLTLFSPDDYAAMDMTYLEGEEVYEQRDAQIEELQATGSATKEQLARLKACDARLDVYHFEQVVFTGDDDDDEFMDPGSLLIVLQKLAHLCRGIGVDPQSGELME